MWVDRILSSDSEAYKISICIENRRTDDGVTVTARPELDPKDTRIEHYDYERHRIDRR